MGADVSICPPPQEEQDISPAIGKLGSGWRAMFEGVAGGEGGCRGCTLGANLEDLRMIQPLSHPRASILQPCFNWTNMARGSRGRQSSRVSQTEADDIDHTMGIVHNADQVHNTPPCVHPPSLQCSLTQDSRTCTRNTHLGVRQGPPFGNTPGAGVRAGREWALSGLRVGPPSDRGWRPSFLPDDLPDLSLRTRCADV